MRSTNRRCAIIHWGIHPDNTAHIEKDDELCIIGCTELAKQRWSDIPFALFLNDQICVDLSMFLEGRDYVEKYGVDFIYMDGILLSHTVQPIVMPYYKKGLLKTNPIQINMPLLIRSKILDKLEIPTEKDNILFSLFKQLCDKFSGLHIPKIAYKI